MSRILALLLLVSCTAYAQVYSSGVVRGGTFWGGLTTRVVEGLGEELVSITNNMIACWPLDEASGTREDDFGTFDLTDNNTVTGTTGPVGLGNASSFNPANSEYLSRADNASLRMGDFSTTFVIWANLSSTASFPAIIGKYTIADRGYALYWDQTQDKFSFLVQNPSESATIVSSSGTYAAGSGWHFIVCGYDKPNTRLFISVDASANATAAMSGPPQGTAAEFRVGNANDAISFTSWNGGLAGAALWNRLLTAIEREALYASGNGSRACEEQGN